MIRIAAPVATRGGAAEAVPVPARRTGLRREIGFVGLLWASAARSSARGGSSARRPRSSPPAP